MNRKPIKRGSTNETIEVALRRGGALIDLTNATTIRFRYKVGATLVERAMIKGASLGTAWYRFTDADFAVLVAAGDFPCDFQVTWPLPGETFAPDVGVDILTVELPLA